MRHKYNSFEYWQNLISKNSTIRGHMFMENLPTKKSRYFHTLIFGKGNGLNNIWGYLPDEMALLGYIQYSFLQEAFYTWINGRDKTLSYIPPYTVEKIITDGRLKNKISKEEEENMKRHLNMLKKMWGLPKEKVMRELKKFARDFNRTWYGDHSEFLYLKVFDTPKDLGEFAIQSRYMSSSQELFEKTTSKNVDDLLYICETATEDEVTGRAFRKILLKYFTEII